MTTSNTIRSPYLQCLINFSPIAEYLETVIGANKFEELVKTNRIRQFIATENLLNINELLQFAKDLDNAAIYCTHCDAYDIEFDKPYDAIHYRKNSARRHRKALKNEKRGVFNSKAFYRDRDGIYDKLEKQSQLKRALEKDLRAQENEYYLISIEPELISESENISKPSATETPLITEQAATKTPEKLLGEAFKNGYHAGYDDGFERGTEIARRDGYAAGFEAGYAAAMRKVKEELTKFSDSL